MKNRKLQATRYKLARFKMSILGMKEQNGPWYLVEHSGRGKMATLQRLAAVSGRTGRPTGICSSPSLDACSAKGIAMAFLKTLEENDLIADLTALRFEEIPPADCAREWPARKKPTIKPRRI